MTVILICILLMALMPYMVTVPGVVARRQQFGTIDNRYPRDQIAQLSGLGKRAYSAQANCFEALVVFLAALLAVYMAGFARNADYNYWVGGLCVITVMARVLYCWCYLLNWSIWRSIFWSIGMLGCLSLLLLAFFIQ